MQGTGCVPVQLPGTQCRYHRAAFGWEMVHPVAQLHWEMSEGKVWGCPRTHGSLPVIASGAGGVGSSVARRSPLLAARSRHRRRGGAGQREGHNPKLQAGSRLDVVFWVLQLFLSALRPVQACARKEIRAGTSAAAAPVHLPAAAVPASAFLLPLLSEQKFVDVSPVLGVQC